MRTDATPIGAPSDLWRSALRILCVGAAVATGSAAAAQTATPPEHGGDQGEMVELAFGDEIELGALITYVSDRLSLNIVYDDAVSKKKITIKSPARVPRGSLRALLESALQTNGLTLTAATGDGWMAIQPAADLASTLAPVTQAGGRTGEPTVVTRVFQLRHSPAVRAEQLLKPFLSKPGANAVAVPEHGLLIVTDFTANIARVEELVELTDRPVPAAQTTFVAVTHAAAAEVAEGVRQLLAARQRGVDAAATAPSSAGAQVVHDERTNQVVLVGAPDAVAEAESLVRALDLPLPASASPVRFYPVRHTKAADMLETIRALEEQTGLTGVGFESPVVAAPASPGEPAADQHPIGPAGADSEGPAPTHEASTPAVRPAGPAARTPARSGGTGGRRGVATADVATNTVIVVGEPAVQQLFSDLIRRLDQPRSQVLIEVTLVILDSSDDFSVGVELASSGDGDPRYLTFSSFGLSTVDQGTGELTLIPGLGFNGTVISADIAQIVIRALHRTGRARVVSTPKILVSDNSTGTISTTTQEPFESVNASDTVATTSFGGFVDAGTTIQVTPHISTGDHLQLDYTFELSSFSGDRASNLPPPRQQNKIESTVTLPDGYTVVTGGVSRTDEAETVTGIPLLRDIPGLGWLFRDTAKSRSETTLFVFIRPLIVRDDRFAYLRYVSDLDASRASLSPELPPSQPLLIR